jgi:hypothetical protein
MTLRTATLKGQKPRNFKVTKEKPVKDYLLKERAGMVSSARQTFARPYFLPTEPEEIKELGEKLLAWSEYSDSTSMDTWFAKNRISPSRFVRLCETNAYLNDCFETALSNIASHLQEKIKENQLYLINKERQHSWISREEARQKREAEKDTQVTKIFVEEKIGIPVFGKKK